MNFSVLGSGRWASFITWYLAINSHNTLEWGRDGSAGFSEIRKNRRNEYVKIPDEVILTTDLKAAIDFADVVIIAIKSQALRSLGKELLNIPGAKDKKILLCMKGIEEDSGLRLSEVMLELGFDRDKIAIWVGPGHIQEFTAGRPNCMVIDGYNSKLVKELVDTLKSKLIRFYYGEDIIGSEIGAAAKNVIGIAAGILDGINAPTLKGPLMARGAREVARLIHAMGGKEMSAYGLCHIGDYETTLFSPHSHNRAYGEAFARGEKFGKLAEGVSTAAAMMRLGEKYGVDLPITRAVYNVLYKGNSLADEISALFERKTVTEFII